MASTYILYVIAAFVFTSTILLGSLIYTKFHWTFKAGLMGLALALFVSSYASIQAALGWPVQAELPEKFMFLGAQVEEPHGDFPGAIYVWGRVKEAEGLAKTPRNYQVPYTREHHKQVQKLMQMQAESGRRGVQVEATRKPDPNKKKGKSIWLRNDSEYEMKGAAPPKEWMAPKQGYQQ